MLKAGVIGCGFISQNKYLPVLSKLKDRVELVGICDLNKRLLEKVAQKFGISKKFTDVNEFLESRNPDFVVIATPTSTHCHLACNCLRMGADVLVEKPMALTFNECDEMIKEAKRHGRKIGIMHNYLFNPAFMKARQLFEDGEIGKFVSIRVLLSTSLEDFPSDRDHWTHRLPVGVIDETGPHGLYLALSYLENVNSVCVNFKKLLKDYPWLIAEDFEVNLVGENGMGSIRFLYASETTDTWIEIFGTKGLIKLNLLSRNVFKIIRPNYKPLTVLKSELKILSDSFLNIVKNSLSYLFAPTIDAHYNGISKFISWLSNDSSYPADGEKGKEVVRVLELVNREILKKKEN